MKTVKTLSLGLLALAMLGGAAGVNAAGPEPWTPQSLSEALKSLPVGDAARGKETLGKLSCGGCHGPQGLAPMPAFPHLAGQPADVTKKSMLDYQTKRRAKGMQAMMMAAAAASVTPEQIADLAAYYETLPGGPGVAPKADAKPAAKADDKKAEAKDAKPAVTSLPALTLVKKGDRTRGITPCAACHGATAAGNPNGQVPVLHGQQSAYLAVTLKAYRSGERSSDLLKEMRVFAQALTDEEIADLAAYYGAQKGREGKVAK